MTFTGGIPQPGQSLGQTQAAVNNNFTNYFNAFSVNHVQPNGDMTYPQGKHKFCEFVSEAQSPATTTAEVAVYCRSLGIPSGIPQLFLQQQNQIANAADIQMSRVDTGALTATGGYSFLPGGTIIQWNIAAANPGGTITKFPIIFPTNCFGVQISMVGATISSLHSVWVKTNYPSSLLADRTQFLAASDNGALGIFYIAMGN
jgi:hypothetical protein